MEEEDNGVRLVIYGGSMHTYLSLGESVLAPYNHNRVLCMVGAVVAYTSQEHSVDIQHNEFHPI